MQHFLKYEVAPSTWTTLKKKIQKTDEDGNTYWNPDLVAVLVDLGCLCQEWGTDEEGNQTCIKQSTKVSIDIVWVGEPLADFNQYLVWPLPVGVSSMGYSLDKEYAQAFCAANPSAAYCQPPQPPTNPS
jgi:hypothetical protein